MLTKDDFEYLLDKQNQLDENIRNTKQITDDEWNSIEMEIKHVIALNVEIAEFVNESKDVWKYWTTKSPNLNKILDEAIDVLHFILLLTNKREGITADYLEEYANKEKVNDTSDMLFATAEVLETDNYATVLSWIFAILDRYGFTRQDILDQYHTKNRENFRRLKNGY